MNKLLIFILLITFLCKSNAQVYTSSPVPVLKKSGSSIEIFDEQNIALSKLKLDFTYNPGLRKKVKSFKVNDQNFLITKEKKGIEHVYTKDWKLVARMTKRGEVIEMIRSGKLYKKAKRKWLGKNELTYVDLQENQVSKSSQVIKSMFKPSYQYTNLSDGEVDALFMTLVLHQTHEEMERQRNDLWVILPICP